MTDGPPADPWTCDHCGDAFERYNPIPVEIPLTGESWDMCDPCVDDMVDWIESGDD